MNIKQEFQNHNPKLVYIDHEVVSPGKIGIGFLAIGGGRVLGGVRIYKVEKGEVDWDSPLETVPSWKDIVKTKGRQR